MIGILFFGLGFVFVVVIVLSLLVNPTLAPRKESVEDAGAKKPAS